MQIGHWIKTTGVNPADLARGVTYVLRGDYIGRTEYIGQADQNKMLQAFGHTYPKTHRPGTILAFDSKQLLGDLI